MSIFRLPEYEADQIEDYRELLLERVIQFENDYEVCVIEEDEKSDLYYDFQKFAKNHQTRTTNKNERQERIKFLSDYLTGVNNGK